MAAQNFLLRSCLLWNGGGKLILNNRFNHIIVPQQPFLGLKTDSQSTVVIPKKPKKPLTGYFKFIVEKRPILLKENPTVPNTEAIKILAAQWRELAPSEKTKYEQEALQLRQQYDQELLDYNAHLTPEQEEKIKEIESDAKEEKKKRKLKKEMKEMGKPLKPLTSFGLFAQPHLIGQRNIIEVITDLKKKWAEMPEVEKEQYHVQYLKHKDAYDKELKKWEQKMINMGKSHLVRAKTLNVKESSKKKNPQ
ncbi:transcription factor A, mitochondrial-like [Anthonomus grandis grandis]|uniref:transcription factor A, mitochondrial-like n=1 Tax=Anthonomus grandis grandis TaxID=2921223 RepID=UPI002165AB94|nr:transcription factor A, mitochondrial-like [Anthonomus grandis grandis]